METNFEPMLDQKFDSDLFWKSNISPKIGKRADNSEPAVMVKNNKHEHDYISAKSSFPGSIIHNEEQTTRNKMIDNNRGKTLPDDPLGKDIELCKGVQSIFDDYADNAIDLTNESVNFDKKSDMHVSDKNISLQVNTLLKIKHEKNESVSKCLNLNHASLTETEFKASAKNNKDKADSQKLNVNQGSDISDVYSFDKEADVNGTEKLFSYKSFDKTVLHKRKRSIGEIRALSEQKLNKMAKLGTDTETMKLQRMKDKSQHEHNSVSHRRGGVVNYTDINNGTTQQENSSRIAYNLMEDLAQRNKRLEAIRKVSLWIDDCTEDKLSLVNSDTPSDSHWSVKTHLQNNGIGVYRTNVSSVSRLDKMSTSVRMVSGIHSNSLTGSPLLSSSNTSDGLVSDIRCMTGFHSNSSSGSLILPLLNNTNQPGVIDATLSSPITGVSELDFKSASKIDLLYEKTEQEDLSITDDIAEVHNHSVKVDNVKDLSSCKRLSVVVDVYDKQFGADLLDLGNKLDMNCVNINDVHKCLNVATEDDVAYSHQSGSQMKTKFEKCGTQSMKRTKLLRNVQKGHTNKSSNCDVEMSIVCSNKHDSRSAVCSTVQLTDDNSLNLSTEDFHLAYQDCLEKVYKLQDIDMATDVKHSTVNLTETTSVNIHPPRSVSVVNSSDWVNLVSPVTPLDGVMTSVTKSAGVFSFSGINVSNSDCKSTIELQIDDESQQAKTDCKQVTSIDHDFDLVETVTIENISEDFKWNETLKNFIMKNLDSDEPTDEMNVTNSVNVELLLEQKMAEQYLNRNIESLKRKNSVDS